MDVDKDFTEQNIMLCIKSVMKDKGVEDVDQQQFAIYRLLFRPPFNFMEWDKLKFTECAEHEDVIIKCKSKFADVYDRVSQLLKDKELKNLTPLEIILFLLDCELKINNTDDKHVFEMVTSNDFKELRTSENLAETCWKLRNVHASVRPSGTTYYFISTRMLCFYTYVCNENICRFGEKEQAWWNEHKDRLM